MDFMRAILPEAAGSLYRRLCAWLLLAAQRRQTGCRKERDRWDGLRRAFRFPANLHQDRAFRALRSLALQGGLWVAAEYHRHNRQGSMIRAVLEGEIKEVPALGC